jgi:uncharacterized RDD family membrane protein YckC
LSQSGSLPAEQYEPFDPQAAEPSTPQWKQEVNQRLAAHRSRRGSSQDHDGARATENPRTASARAAEAAARVAARYAKAPSYSQLLAGEARAVVRAAGAAAEAARNAQAAAQAVLRGLESGPIASGLWEPAQQEREGVSDLEKNASAQAAPSRWLDEPPAEAQAVAQIAPYAGAQPRWEEALPVTAPAPRAGRDLWSEMRVHPNPEPVPNDRQEPQKYHGHGYGPDAGEGELFPGDSFDSFDSYDPMGSAMVEPVQHLPANLIEFPRELVATRKARPRLAEGPFYDASHHNSQLSIFEVDPDSLDSPAALKDGAATAVAPPEWASIELDHHPEPSYANVAVSQKAYAGQAHTEGAYVAATQIPTGYAAAVEDRTAIDVAPVSSGGSEVGATRSRIRSNSSVPAALASPSAELMVAPLSDRLLAAVVDGALVTLAFLAAAVVVLASTAHPPTGRLAIVACGCGWLLFGLLYEFLFLSYAEEGTPGMRYARIALCTFDDDNPSVEQMRRRIPALLLATLPAGLGLAWAIFDGNHLGWHDRLTKTYQRKY